MTSPNKALETPLDVILSKAKAAGADSADAMVSYGRSLSISVRGGELEDIDNSEGRDIGLRVMIDGRQACVSSSDLSDGSLDQLVERAVAMAKLAPPDPYCGLADFKDLADGIFDLELSDNYAPEPKELQRRAQEVEAAALNIKGVEQANGSSASFSQGEFVFGTSHGFRAGWSSSRHGISTAAIAAKDGNKERDYDYATRRFFSDLPDTTLIGKIAGERAVARLGATKIKSGAIPVIYEDRKAATLLSAFLSAINGTSVARGVSFLKDNMDETIFAPKIDIIDDPLMVRGLGSRPCDGEGLPTRKNYLVKKGVLKSWTLNCAAARQLGLKSTANATRSIAHPPGIGISNCYIPAGKINLEAMFKNVGKALFVTDMFGPNINSNTGDYSVGVSGFLIENGEKTIPVSEVTIAGNLKEMFKTLTAANDLKFDGTLNAPSLCVEGMMIAGL